MNFNNLNIQDYMVIIIGAVAAAYVLRKFLMQFFIPEDNPKCDKCPVSPKNRKIN